MSSLGLSRRCPTIHMPVAPASQLSQRTFSSAALLPRKRLTLSIVRRCHVNSQGHRKGKKLIIVCDLQIVDRGSPHAPSHVHCLHYCENVKTVPQPWPHPFPPPERVVP